MTVLNLLTVEDDLEFQEAVVRWFTRKGAQIAAAGTGEAAIALCERHQFDVAILDLRLPGMSGLDVLKKLRADHPETEVLLLTGEGTIETAVEAMKLGAFDYILKPCALVELERMCGKAAEHGRLKAENERMRTVLDSARPPANIIGQSLPMKELFRLIERAGPSDKPILIEGESGTGKELVARALQRASHRADRPYVVINCAALPETLLESELFGHEKGAFTGAATAKPGLFEVADGGTLFIDEIGELAASLQAKLLRVLEDGSMRRVGSLKERHVDVRLIAATNRKLAAEVAAGRFREDLLYRINVMLLELPPLRERTGDIPLLIDHFLGPKWSIEADAREALTRYSWPGNVRQLINVLERGKILADDGVIDASDLPGEIVRHSGCKPPASGDDLESIERAHVMEILHREGGNKSKAARALGVTRRSLYRLLERLGVPDKPGIMTAGPSPGTSRPT